MNERILELYKQAHERQPVMVIDPATGNPIQVSCVGKPMFQNEFDPEKFAELIVSACAGIVNSLEQYEGSGDCYTAEYIKKYFGVE